MASERITCPECKSVLRPAKPVPDGKEVKCPKCGNKFVTPGLTDDVIAVVEEDRPPKKSSGKKKAKTGIKKASGPKPARKKTDLDDDDDDGGIYSFAGAKDNEEKPDIVYAPDMSIKDLRGPAQEAVVKPSNLIMLICGLSALSNLFLICWSFWPMIFSESVVDWQTVLEKHYKKLEDKNAVQRVQSIKEFKDLKDKDLELVQQANEDAVSKFPTGRLWLMGGFILLLIYNAIVMIGAVKMQNLESRRWGIASSILMFLPMGSGGLSSLFALGVSFLEQMTGFLGDVTEFYMLVVAGAAFLASIYVGYLSLRTLLSQEVIDGFEYVAE
jgi:predicted Zn finger-like uncharacterized protein